MQMIIDRRSPSTPGVLRWTSAGDPIRPGLIWILANDLEEGAASLLMILNHSHSEGLNHQRGLKRMHIVLTSYCCWNKLSRVNGLKQYEFITLGLCGPELWQGSQPAKVRVCAGLHSFWRLWGGSVSSLFPALIGPFRCRLSLQFSAARKHSSLWRKGRSCWATQIIQNTLPSARSLTSVTSAKSLCRVRWHIYSVWGLGCGLPWRVGSLSCPPHT